MMSSIANPHLKMTLDFRWPKKEKIH